MRIAVIARGIWPLVLGGAERVTKEVVLSGHELKVITKCREAALEALRYNGVVIASDIFVKTGVLREDVAFVYPRSDAGALDQTLTIS